MTSERRETTEVEQPAASATRAIARRRKTNGKACVTCHLRKVRCDVLQKGFPCSNCQSQNKLDCRLYESKRSRAPRPIRDHVPIRPRERESLTAPTNPGAVMSGPAIPVAPPPRPSSLPADGPDYGSGGSVSPAAADNASDSEDEHASRNLAEFIGREEIRYRVITDGSRLFFLGTEVSNPNYLVRQRPQNTPGGVHFGSRQLALKYTAHEFKHVPAEALELPEKSLADELVEAYFVRINRGWPIVDEEDFMTKYNGNDPRNPVQLPLLHAIFLVGAHVLASTRPELKDLKAKFFRRVKMLVDCRLEQDRGMYVQVALLLTWHSDGLEDVVANSWHWVGIAARTAFGLGMHRDASQSSMLPVHKRIWVRLWWVLVQFDVLTSTIYGRPQAIDLDDSDVQSLQPVHFEGIRHANIDFVIEHTRLCVIFGKAMRRRVALRCTLEERAEATRVADEALADLVMQLPEKLRLSVPEADTWQSCLHLTYNNFLLLLHRPYPQSDIPQTSFESSSDLNICGDATVVITSIFEVLRSRNSLADLWLPGINALFTAMVHVSGEMDSMNRLVAAKATRMFDSLLLSIRGLSGHWLYAQSVLHLFEEEALRRKRRHENPSGPVRQGFPGPGNGLQAEMFSLRPDSFSGPDGSLQFQNPTRVSTSEAYQGSSLPSSFAHNQVVQGQQPSHGPFHPGENSPVLNMIDGSGRSLEHRNSGEMSRDQLWTGSFLGNEVGMSNDQSMALGSLPFSEASALEFLLAGMGNGFEF